jgi:hypothetical protein
MGRPKLAQNTACKAAETIKAAASAAVAAAGADELEPQHNNDKLAQNNALSAHGAQQQQVASGV